MNFIDIFNDLTVATKNKVCQNGGFFMLDKNIYQRIFNDVDKSLQFSKEDTVLDLGCGNGEVTKFVAPRVKKVVLIDGAVKLLEIAQQTVKDFKNTESMVVDLNTSFNISDLGTFDKILCYSVVHYLYDYQKFENLLKEMVKALRPGGRILIGDIPLADKREKYLQERRKKPLVNLWGNLRHFLKKKITAFMVGAGGKKVEMRSVIFTNKEMINQSIEKLNGKDVKFFWVQQDKRLIFPVSREDLLIVKK